MRQQAHAVIGMTTALLVVQPKSFAEVACATAGGLIGGVIADIDVNNHNGSKDNIKDGLLFGYCIAFLCIILAADYLLGNGICKYVLSQSRYTILICSLLIAMVLIFGYRSSHRSFMHSIFALCFFTAMIWIAFKPATIPFSVGYLSHILLDLTNKRGVQLLFPYKKRFCFGWCSSSGDASDFLVNFGNIIGGSQLCFYILRARVVYHDGTEFFARLNRPVIGEISFYHCYLIIVNFIAIVVFMGVYSYSVRHEETEGRQGLYFWYFELLCLIGGAIGILFSFRKKRQLLGKHTATMYAYTFAMIEAWSILYMIIVNPFGHTLTAMQYTELSSHLRFIVYFVVVNIVLLLVVIVDRDSRHIKWSIIETIEVLLGLLGGTFLISIVSWFHGFRGNNVFGWGFSILCATHTFAIGYLLCAGLI